ncbi:putative disease resistance protein At3g14460 [Vigna umbellata]|uniref:putative disease resistance protein At3g14460 n=1 Tax=Vigna umbellata TaxID=87088 RepID=UPI001F5F403F|nr:putative disease resistance protein At3g14460 [Vigna umbellata]
MAAALVGGALLSSFLNVLFERLATREFVNFIRGKKADKWLQKMKNQLLVVKVVLDDAEKKQITDSNIKEWLDLLSDVVYEVDDILDEVSTKAATQKKVSYSFCDLFKKKKIVSKLEDIVGRLDDILKQKESLGLKLNEAENDQPPEPQPTSLEGRYGMYGRDEDKEAIMKLVSEDSSDSEAVSVISIVGMPGVGKTTLARSVYNDDKLTQIFDLKAWVRVSDRFDIVKVTKAMLEEITQKPCTLSDLNSIQHDLLDKLKGKRFLIVLDDVWIEDCDVWSSLTKPFLSGIRGSKVLVTTRNESVAAGVPFHSAKYDLKILLDEDCWLVFESIAFPLSEVSENRGTLENIGKKIVQKCDGLPLAAQSLGGMLRRKHDIRDWNNVLESDIWALPGSIIPALRISYNHLPPHLKRCFVYCSLYPKDFEFRKDELILLWMAEDLIKTPRKGKTLEEVGHDYFDDLVSRSFFQCSTYQALGKYFGNRYGNCFVMHDLMHDLATFLGGEFYFRANELGKETKIDIKTRHLSFRRFSDPVSDIEVFDTVKFLRTFLPINYEDSPFNNEKAPCIIVSMLKYLRVLSFRAFQSQLYLPDSIGELIHLRYLNLSSTSIAALPESLCNLYNLQTLKLYGCSNLTKLPRAMQNLVNLRHLIILNTPIEEMPHRMGKLNQLHNLDCYTVGKHKENSIKELGGLPNLHGWFCVQKLENVTTGEEALEARIMDKKHIYHLSLEWSERNDNSIDFQIELDVLGKLQPHQNLESLSINGYQGTRFPEWMRNFSIPNITNLYLTNCSNCSKLPSLGQLPSLKLLRISEMNSVKTIDASFYKEDCSSLTPFPALQSLHIVRMPYWEVWSSFVSEAFPVLNDLLISECPNLRGDFPDHLPALQTLVVTNCDLLVSSVQRAPTLRTLEIYKTNKIVFHEFPLLVETIEIEGRPMVESMMEVITSIQLPCLHYLSLQDCSLALSFPGDCLPASLKTLDISGLSNLKFPMLHKHKLLESLSINNSCDSLKSLPLVNFPNLISLQIRNCENLESLLILRSESLKSLNSFELGDCPNFASFPEEGFSAPNLTRFSVYGCVKLNSLPYQMETHLPKMEYLSISNCQQIEGFPEEGMPPNLTTVKIRNCEKLLSSLEWISMVMVTSLKVCGPCDGMNSFPKEGLLLPSLTSLHLCDFSSLETLDCKGILHLTLLQELHIENCQKLENIVGERLPVSLIKLRIEGCPLLQKLCHRKHRKIWPKICHVRGINIDGRWI